MSDVRLLSLWTRLLEWREQARTRKALERLSDHQLWDIGLERSDIDWAARNAQPPARSPRRHAIARPETPGQPDSAAWSSQRTLSVDWPLAGLLK